MALIWHRRRTFSFYKEIEMPKWARLLMKNVNVTTYPSQWRHKERGLTLVEFATVDDLVLANTLSRHEALRFVEFATFNELVLANTLSRHEAFKRWTWHSPNGRRHNQIYYILLRKRFRSGVNSARTRSFPGEDIRNDHYLQMMNSMPKHTRLKFDL